MICDWTEHKKQNDLVFLFSSPSLQSEIGPNSLGCAFYLHHQWSAPRLSLSSLATGFIFNIGPNLNIMIVQHILIVILSLPFTDACFRHLSKYYIWHSLRCCRIWGAPVPAKFWRITGWTNIAPRNFKLTLRCIAFRIYKACYRRKLTVWPGKLISSKKTPKNSHF